MKRILEFILLSLMIFLIFSSICGCVKNSIPNEMKITQDLNECENIKKGVINCAYVHMEEYSIKDFEIEKRQTNKEEKEDIIFANVTLQNTYFQTKLYCKIIYLYFDDGGWIFENCEILEKNSMPLSGVLAELCNCERVDAESYNEKFSLQLNNLNFNNQLTVVKQETDCENGSDTIYLKGMGNNYTYTAKSEFYFDQEYGWVAANNSDKYPTLLEVDVDLSKLLGTFVLADGSTAYEEKLSGTFLSITSFDEQKSEIKGILGIYVNSSYIGIDFTSKFWKDTFHANFSYMPHRPESGYDLFDEFGFEYDFYGSDYGYCEFSLDYDFDEDAWIFGGIYDFTRKQ